MPSRRSLSAIIGIVVTLSLSGASGPAAAELVEPVDLTDRGWVWPAVAFTVESPYAAPAHRYGSGHRGVDLRLLGDLALRAPADGVVAFAGRVVDRDVVTIDHGDGLVTTLEPATPVVGSGDLVRQGDPVAALSVGGHAAPGTVHFGVRLHGEYINPMLLLDGVPRAVLLPCC